MNVGPRSFLGNLNGREEERTEMSRTLWLLILMFVLLAGAFLQCELYAMAVASAACALVCGLTLPTLEGK